MSSAHVGDDLAPYVLGELPPVDARRVAEHLVACRECHAASDALRTGLDEVRRLGRPRVPEAVWDGIMRELDARDGNARTPDAATLPAASGVIHATSPQATRAPHRASGVRTGAVWLRRAAAVVAILGVGGGLGAYALGIRTTAWGVEHRALDTTPTVRQPASATWLAEGDWLETEAGTTARLAIGRLGTAEVGPESRLRLVRAGGAAHTLRMERGELHARVWAPPRFFLVETPAATAVDLGCVYSLRVDDAGAGMITVVSGQVELARAARTSLVVAGTAATMRPGFGPGTPFSLGESDAFRVALDALDYGQGAERDQALDRVLTESDAGSTITLWHLLPRVPHAERVRVYERLARLSPPPRGVTAEGVLALDPGMLQRWRNALEPTWSDERVFLWKKAWRALWSIARGR